MTIAQIERLSEALKRRGMDPGEFFAHALAVVETTEPVALSENLAETLEANGGPSSSRVRALESRIAAGALIEHRIETQALAIATTLTGPQAAKLLGRDPSRIRARVGKRDLVSFGRGRGRRLPVWQFDGTETIPGIPGLAKVIPEDAHPLAVHEFMTHPHPNLMVGDVSVSPRDWLIGHGSVDRVIALLEQLGQW